MKKPVQVTALLFTSALLLAACGQSQKEETTVATTQETTQATTQATTTQKATTAQAQTQSPNRMLKKVKSHLSELMETTLRKSRLLLKMA